MARPVPRPFTMPWGGGEIVEEASIVTEHNEPTIQLLRYSGDESWETVRFCQYWLTGQFQRQPMMLAAADVANMREALKRTPRLRELLRELVAD